jgi:hypothetical protein
VEEDIRRSWRRRRERIALRWCVVESIVAVGLIDVSMI